MVDAPPRGLGTSPEAPDILHFTSADIDQVRALLNRFYYPVAVDAPEGTDGFTIGMEMIQLGPLTVGQLAYAVPVTLLVAELDAYHVSMPTSGRMHARHAGHEVYATPSTGAVFRPGSSVYVRHDAHSAALSVKIERAALEDELAGLLGHPVEGPLDLPPVMNLAEGPGHSWYRLIRLLRDELQHDQSLIYQPLIAEQLRSSVLSGLLLSLPHRYYAELTGPVAVGPPRAVRRAIEAIHEEPEHPFSVGDLAAIAGMSVRSLQEGFRRHLGCPPMSYLQGVRLERARDSLRRSDPSRVTVAAVAHRWGFAHLGRFACAYRARFGESPSETLRTGG